MAYDIKKALTVKNLNISYKEMKRFRIKKLKKDNLKKSKKFQAIKNVSFDVYQGEVLGIIGKNGSGKTTLLKSIAKIFSPDSGTIKLYGNSVSLLSLGTGFQKQLSGYENIILSGLLMGFTKKQIKSKINEIIEFSELGDFVYKPVKTYSSGMFSKLAFAITVILETDIMLIDEIFSVGDANFRKKSFDKIKELINARHRTVVIVSHNSSTLRFLCDRVVWLDNGEVKKTGDTKEILALYEESIN